MRDMDDSCPFEQNARAAQCPNCIERHRSLSPCVTAWLQTRIGNTAARLRIVPVPAFTQTTRNDQKAA